MSDKQSSSTAPSPLPGPADALFEKQATLSFVQQTARIATWQLDLATGNMTFDDGSYPVFSRPFLQIKTLDDLHSFVHPDDLHAIHACIRQAIDTNTNTTVDYRITIPSGDILWLENRTLPIINQDGVATTLRGMTTDITVRKQNEEKLASSEARYRVLTELNPQAIWMGAPDGSIIYANQGFLDYIGKTLEGLVGLGWLEAFDPTDHERVVEAWTHSIATGTEYAIEAHLIRAKDKVARWWSLRGLPVRDDSGAILHWLGVAYDVHDNKTTADTLRQKQEETERQRAELETVYRTAPVGLGLFDPVEYRYLRLNDRLAEIIGLPPERILGRTITEVAPTSVKEVFDQVVATREMQRRLIDGEFPSRPGEKHFFNVNYAPVFAPDGSIQAIATATLDITHQKKAESALIQSEKLAAVGRLASSISHEINNPLEAITNLLFLAAMDESLPDSIKTYIHMAQSELSRVSQIATQTLRFHRQAVKPTLVSPAELVSAVLNLYQGRLGNSSIHVNAKYATSTPILCFENDIRQVLNNLIANAIDAMRTGGQIVVRAHDTTDVTTHRKGVRITIADTGHGMSPDVRARIFEPFYTTKDLNGTGLGLWISSGIVSHHNGSLTVRSSLHPIHHGTIFSLFLPHPEP
ncbi:PAS domain-containing protein [Granulicella arctica]|uniref:histidine kinase n=1 Tax=Granulicella arctica TaxID=940613 RepID=A0A7Y9TFI4_9BACT|nr:PAS domain-containing protein [Granulicella arctica]NYF78836.1 PAS domain S-box-containing protein [Granulicella arctica]